MVPGGDCTEQIQDEADGSADEGVLHGISGSDCGSDVAADDAVKRAVDGCPEELLVGIDLAEFGEAGDEMEQIVCSERKNDYGDEACHDAKNAAADIGLSWSFVHELWAPR